MAELDCFEFPAVAWPFCSGLCSRTISSASKYVSSIDKKHISGVILCLFHWLNGVAVGSGTVQVGTTAVANGDCGPHAVGRWRTQLERVLLSPEAETFLRALGSRVATTVGPCQQAVVSLSCCRISASLAFSQF